MNQETDLATNEHFTELEQEKEDLAKETQKNMGFEISQNSLVKALSYVQGIVERKNIIPILNNIKFENDNGFLSITATDMDVEVSEKIEADKMSSGAGFTVPAHTFCEIVKKMPAGSTIKVTPLENSQIQVIAEKSRFNLPILPSKDYPKMDYDSSFENSFKIQANDLKKMIDATKYSICNEETRYNLNGIYFHTEAATNEKNGALKMASTDGHRLSSSWTDLPEGLKQMPPVIIPKKTIFELKKILDDLVTFDANSSVEVAVSESKILFYFGNLMLVSKLIDAKFPDYENHIPKNSEKTIKLNQSALKEALERVSIVSFEKTKGVKFILEPNKLELVAANQSAGGNGDEILEVSSNSEFENLEIGFNSRYLLELLASFHKGEIELSFNDKSSPMMFWQKPKPTDRINFVHVVMPIRV